MSNSEENLDTPELISGGKRPHVRTYANVPAFYVGDSVYYTQSNGVRDGPFLVVTAPSGGTCTLCYSNGRPYQDNARINQHTIPTNIKCFTATAISLPDKPGLEEDPTLWPTYSNVTAAIREVTATAQPGHCVYIHFSGHGVRLPPMGEFSDYGTGDLALGLLSRDATRVQPLGGQLLAILLNAMVTKGLVVTLVLDCCFAASIYRLERKNVRFLPFDAATFVMDHDEPTETIAQASSSCRDLSMQPSWLIDPNGYAILAACGPHEEATEVILGGVEHGALSFFLARSLRDFGMNKRHRDVFYRISPSFKANKLDQTPALYGNKNQEFFGPHTLATTRSVIPAYKSRQETFTLEAGQAHGFRGGDDFILYPSGVVDGSAALHNNVIAARISNLGPLTSVLGLTYGGKITETKCVAEPQSRQCFHDFPITLSDEVPKPEEWIAAFQSYSLAVYRASEGHPAWLNLQVIGDEYKIYNKHGQQLNNIPVLQRGVVGPEDVAALFQHIVRYEFVKTLKNDSVPARFRSLFEVSIKTRADDIFTPDNIVDVEEDTRNKYMFELIVQNKCPEELYLHIFNLGPFWQVENVFYGTTVLPPQTFEDQFTGKFSKKMRTMVPKEMRAMGSRQCEDILKVIVTSHPTSFDMLELPKIGGSPKKPVVDEHRTTIKEAPGWMAFNFPVRISMSIL
ncbi:hypothetical protein HG531_012436 [Fusarium graminearum]|nr:hypothetical protein HG531_012436 [Fusarium graminearum]